MAGNIRIARKLLRLARMMLANIYRKNVLPSGFGRDRTKNAIVVSNRSGYPVAFAYKDGNDIVILTRCMSLKKAYEKYQRLLKEGVICNMNDKFFMYLYSNLDYISEAMRQIERGKKKPARTSNGVVLNDFKMAINLALNHVGTPYSEMFLSKGRTPDIYSVEDARKILTDEYDVYLDTLDEVMPLPEYETGANGKNKPIVRENTVVSSNGFEFHLNGSSLTKDKIDSIAGKVKALLPACMQKLCYGKVELRAGFARGWNWAGDYDIGKDVIRLSGKDEDDIVRYMVHEIGHRWYYKFATHEQIAALKNAFSNANSNRNGLSLSKGDVVELPETEFKYECIKVVSPTEVVVKSMRNGLTYNFDRNKIRLITKVNGQPIDHFQFPTAYASTNIREFVSECFMAYFMGKIQDQSLVEYLKPIFEGGETV